jgi:hypothetical protein
VARRVARGELVEALAAADAEETGGASDHTLRAIVHAAATLLDLPQREPRSGETERDGAAATLAWRCVPLMRAAKSSLGDTQSSLGDAESSLGAAKSSLGDTESSLGDV